MKKIIVIGVIALFIVVGFQPALANDNTLSSGIVEKQQLSGIISDIIGGSNTYNWCVQQTTDGGYIIVGHTETFKTPEHPFDIWLIKTDINGNMKWDKTFGDFYFDSGWYVVQTTDGGYIISGNTGYGDVWLLKTDGAGNLEWDKTFEDGAGFCIQQTADGGYILTGRTRSFGAGGFDVLLIKTDSTGDEEWNQTYGGAEYDEGWCVQDTTDGGYIIIGETESFGAGEEDFWLIKTDSYGNMIWERTFGGSQDDSSICGQQTNDGGYIIIGTTRSFSEDEYRDVWLIKTDNAGNMMWNRTFGGPKSDWGYCVQQTTDGGYIISGQTTSFGTHPNSEGWLIKTDSIGNMVWNKTFGLKFHSCHFVQQTSDGGYIITGGTPWCTYLIKTDSDGNKEWDRILERKSKAVIGNMLLLRILERFPMLQKLLLFISYNIKI
jgi:hypothetical protein